MRRGSWLDGGRKGGLLTFSAGVGLHELVTSTGLVKFRGQPCQLRQHLIDDADFGCQTILVDVKGEEPSYVSQPSDDEDRGLLRHGEAMEKKGGRKGGPGEDSVDEEAGLDRGGARSRWWQSGEEKKKKGSDRGLRGVNGPSAGQGSKSRQRQNWAGGLFLSLCNSRVQVEGPRSRVG